MSQPLETTFEGHRTSLFSLATKLSLLTVLTLGFYRFWMKTRLRRWYWSAIQPGGHPLEYTGNGWEKLLGFLVAVVFLAFYLGIVNLILMFASFSVFQGVAPAYGLSLLGVLPLIFYAQYRARRYLLARTRWRGVRFGLEPGAWGYALRAALYWLASILTLGLLWPLQTFKLEAYRTNRTWFGSAKLHQNGRWTALILPWLPCLLGLWSTAGLVAYATYTENPALVAPLLGTVPFTAFAYLFFTVRAFRYLTGQKTLGRDLHLAAHPRTGRVMWILVWGNFLVMLVLSIASGTLLAAFAGVAAVVGMGLDTSSVTAAGWLAVLVGLVAYFAFFVMWDVLRQVFVRVPLLAHYAGTLTIENPHGLAALDQRSRDEMEQAEGFAEALDVGAAL